MGATYTRQSSSAIVDGGIIEAADINAEFNQILAAFAVSSGHTHDGTAAEGGPITKLLGTAITIGDATAGTDIAITFDGESNDGVLTWMEDEDYFQFSDDLLVTTTEKLQFRDTAIYINSSADGQLDLVADTEIQIAATTVDINGNVDVSGTLTVGGALDFSDASISNIGSIALDTITNDGTDITLDSSGDIILDAGGANITIKDDGTSILDIANSSSDVELTVSVADKNFKIKGTDDSSAITALDIDMALAGKATFNGDVVVGGDLTVTGDDITMGTNTAGHLLIADGTNFNSIAATSLSEISTIANDDVFLAVDTSGGGLKKVARSTVVSGLATSAAISNVSEDSTPQLGGNLDMNGADIVTTSNATIDLAPNGTGTVVVRGNTNSGAIVFNCESNSHGQKVIAQPHSAGVTNVMLLPAGADSTLVSLVSTDTLTNKTLTSPKINEDVVLTATSTELNLIDGITAGTISASKAVIVDSNKDISGFRNVTLTGELDAGSLDISGDADIDGTLEADAITINGTTLAETISDTVGAMVGSNTETGIAVTYDDSDNTLDFVISALPLSSIDIDGGTDIGADLTTSDLIVVDDGAGGTNRKAALSRIVTLMTAQGFVTDDPTALAIALG